MRERLLLECRMYVFVLVSLFHTYILTLKLLDPLQAHTFKVYKRFHQVFITMLRPSMTIVVLLSFFIRTTVVHAGLIAKVIDAVLTTHTSEDALVRTDHISYAPSSIPSTIPSLVPSTIPSTSSSDVPSTIPSDAPTGTGFLQSDTPSDAMSSMPTISNMSFREDAIQEGLETLDLLGYRDIQSWTGERKVLMNGTQEYVLDNVVPYVDLFASKQYKVHRDGFRITNRYSNESFPIPIYRSSTQDGKVIQLATNEQGNIAYAEIRDLQGSFKDDLFFIPSDVLRESSLVGDDASSQKNEVLISFTNGDLDNIKFGNRYDLDEIELPLGETETDTPSLRRKLRRTSDATLLSNVAAICDQYQIVKVAIVYDASLCLR
jgi:hypothetical protein